MILLTGVIDGPITGQINTTLIVRNLLEKELGPDCVKFIKQPNEISFKFFLKYYYQCFNLKRWKKVKKSYISISRTKKSFFTRDLIFIIMSYIFCRKIYIHIVGNDFIKFLGSSWLANKFYTRLTKSRKIKYIVLSDRMGRDMVSFYGLNEKEIEVDYSVAAGFVQNNLIRKYDTKDEVNNNDKKVFKVGFMSNLIPGKGIFEVLNAMELLFHDNPKKWSFWVAGAKQKNIYYDKLDKMVQKGICEYYPFIDGSEKIKLLEQTDIFLLPTYYPTEGLPLALLEAGYFGCFLISCDAGDIGSIINCNTGTIIPDRSVSSIVNSVKVFIENDKFSKKRCHYFFKKKYSLNSYEAKIKKIIIPYGLT
jgi:glycosyltransferase involved in cell wall biosynthesis